MVINFLSDGTPSAESKRRANVIMYIVNYQEKTYHLRLQQSVGKKDAQGQFVGEQTFTIYEGNITIPQTKDPVTITLP